MFGQLEVKTRKGWTVLVSIVGQSVLVGFCMLLPMIYFEVLPAAELKGLMVAPPPPAGPPPPAAPAPPIKLVKVIPRQFDQGKLTAPKVIPKEIALIKEDELPPSVGPGNGPYIVGGIPNGDPNSKGDLIKDIIGGIPNATPPPPVPLVVAKKETAAALPSRIKIGGDVQQAKLVRQPKPVYPPLARQIRVQGTVRLSAVISKDGTIMKLEVISGHPLLVPAAMEAVKQWVYQPTLLNQEPVEVITQIDVNFTLSQ